VNALANPEVGKFINEHFVSSFQKVATFRIVNGQKQGGNVAAYFCATDGRVLHVVAGPVDAGTMLREAKWVVDTTEKCLAENKKSGKLFKVLFREAHANRLKQEYGMQVEAVTFDYDATAQGALSYRDPSGQPLAPVLPPPPVEGPDVTIGEANVRQLQAGNAKSEKAALDLGVAPIVDRGGRRWNLGNQGRAHMLLAAHSMQTIDKVYGSVFEGILGEKISNKPVEIVTPFPWHRGKNINLNLER
jgi:hypothetical protein